MEDGKTCVQVNLPDTAEHYESGNGEGCWADLEGAAREAYEHDACGGRYEAVLRNDSIYYPGLACGTVVPIEMRGANRPVVPYAWLVENYAYDPALKNRIIAVLLGESG